MSTAKSRARNLMTGLRTLFRAMPVITYSGTLVLLNVACAWADGGDFVEAAPMLFLGVFIINGLMAHSLNDIEDWKTGTDKVSQGILSGGSKVLKRGLLSERDLKVIAWTAVVVALAIALYLYSVRGPLVLGAIVAGMTITWAYTNPPFRLAYHPFIGELIGLGISGLMISVTSYFVMTGSFSITSFLASCVQTLLLLGWIMQHHIPDVPADLSAVPVKLTTPAYFYRRWGIKSVIIPSIIYFFLAYGISLSCIFNIDFSFFLMAMTSLICALIAAATDTADIKDVTQKELITTFIIILNAIGFSIQILILR